MPLMNIEYQGKPSRGGLDSWEEEQRLLNEMYPEDLDQDYDEDRGKHDAMREAYKEAMNTIDEDREYNTELIRLRNTRGHGRAATKPRSGGGGKPKSHKTKLPPPDQLNNKEYGLRWTVQKKVMERVIQKGLLTRELSTPKIVCRCTVVPKEYVVNVNHINSLVSVLKSTHYEMVEEDTGVWARLQSSHTESDFYYFPIRKTL